MALANIIFKQTKAGRYQYFYDFYTDPIQGNDGKIYTPFYYKRYVSGYGYSVYEIGVAYSGERIINPTFAKIGIKTFKGELDSKTSASTIPIEVKTSNIGINTTGAYDDYNVDKKIGFYSLKWFVDFEVPIMNADATDREYSFNIPYAGDLTNNPNAFWNTLSKLPKPKLQFELDNSIGGGGDGVYDDNSSDTIDLPNIDLLNINSISNTKFFSCYKMTPLQLSALGTELWSSNFFTQLSNTVLKPTDFIVSLNMIPIEVPSTNKLIKAGTILLNGAMGGLINTQFVRLNCGSLEIKKKWGGAIDYQTEVSLFLPFIGEVNLNANEVIGATLTIFYTIDIMSGNCIASVKVVKGSLNAILYQYNGNVASNYAITSQDYANVFGSMLQLAVGVASGGVSGGASTIATVGATSNMLSGANVHRTGNVSASSGFMGIKKPYLILSRPIQSLPEDYNTFRGYVSNITLTLSECSGFTKVAEIHLENIPATSSELDELDGLLKAGVVF